MKYEYVDESFVLNDLNGRRGIDDFITWNIYLEKARKELWPDKNARDLCLRTISKTRFLAWTQLIN